MKRSLLEIVIIFHQAKVRVEQNICIAVERKGSWVVMSTWSVVMGQRFNPSLRICFLYSVSTPSQNEQRMSLMAVIYQLATFSPSGFCYSQCSMPWQGWLYNYDTTSLTPGALFTGEDHNQGLWWSSPQASTLAWIQFTNGATLIETIV